MASSSWKIFCVLAAICIMTEAHVVPNTKHKEHGHHESKPVQKSAGPPQKQTMFGFPVDQGAGTGVAGQTGPSIMGSSIFYPMDDSSSSEETSDVDMDMDMDVDAGTATSYVFGRSGNQITGNLRPMFRSRNRGQQIFSGVEAGDFDQLKGRTTGSSGRGVGIAFAVLGLLALVVAAAFFTIRRYRHNIPVLVHT